MADANLAVDEHLVRRDVLGHVAGVGDDLLLVGEVVHPAHPFLGASFGQDGLLAVLTELVAVEGAGERSCAGGTREGRPEAEAL